jgi:hypothetical protein
MRLIRMPGEKTPALVLLNTIMGAFMRRTLATLACLLYLAVPAYAVTIDDGHLSGSAMTDFLIFNPPPLSGEGVTIDIGAPLLAFSSTFPISPSEGQPYSLNNTVPLPLRTLVTIGDTTFTGARRQGKSSSLALFHPFRSARILPHLR